MSSDFSTIESFEIDPALEDCSHRLGDEGDQESAPGERNGKQSVPETLLPKIAIQDGNGQGTSTGKIQQIEIDNVTSPPRVQEGVVGAGTVAYRVEHAGREHLVIIKLEVPIKQDMLLQFLSQISTGIDLPPRELLISSGYGGAAGRNARSIRIQTSTNHEQAKSILWHESGHFIEFSLDENTSLRASLREKRTEGLHRLQKSGITDEEFVVKATTKDGYDKAPVTREEFALYYMSTSELVAEMFGVYMHLKEKGAPLDLERGAKQLAAIHPTDKLRWEIIEQFPELWQHLLDNVFEPRYLSARVSERVISANGGILKELKSSDVPASISQRTQIVEAELERLKPSIVDAVVREYLANEYSIPLDQLEHRMQGDFATQARRCKALVLQILAGDNPRVSYGENLTVLIATASSVFKGLESHLNRKVAGGAFDYQSLLAERLTESVSATGPKAALLLETLLEQAPSRAHRLLIIDELSLLVESVERRSREVERINPLIPLTQEALVRLIRQREKLWCAELEPLTSVLRSLENCSGVEQVLLESTKLLTALKSESASFLYREILFGCIRKALGRFERLSPSELDLFVGELDSAISKLEVPTELHASLRDSLTELKKTIAASAQDHDRSDRGGTARQKESMPEIVRLSLNSERPSDAAVFGPETGSAARLVQTVIKAKQQELQSIQSDEATTRRLRSEIETLKGLAVKLRTGDRAAAAEMRSVLEFHLACRNATAGKHTISRRTSLLEPAHGRVAAYAILANFLIAESLNRKKQ
ncbi:MAG: hypothetical protein K2W95_17680 [Candidatus Obscuribacterales bacterium]|nr:hypothetical protein [Candidatus Obscuribacterales bacterium]